MGTINHYLTKDGIACAKNLKKTGMTITQIFHISKQNCGFKQPMYCLYYGSRFLDAYEAYKDAIIARRKMYEEL